MTRIVRVLLHGVAMAAVTSFGACAPDTGGDDGAPATATVDRAVYGVTPAGDTVEVFTLRNANGMEVEVIEYGGIVTRILAPDRDGQLADVVLGMSDLDGYVAGTPYFGALIGRYGNRIGGARFTLDGETYELSMNDGPNSLHGGERGFDKVVWDAEPMDGAVGLVLRYTSPDGEMGYPGTVVATVTYTMNNRNELAVDYHATTDAATPINLTQHSYFNLGGEGSGDVLDHELMIDAAAFTPVDSTLIPTGEIRPVEGTPFDFRTATPIGARIDADDRQLRYGLGYDHNWVLDRDGDGLEVAARLIHPGSGRTLEIRTTEPGIQFYSGNFLDGTLTGKAGHVYQHRNWLCLETQHFPDSPNQPSFPPTILRPGEDFRSRTVMAFGVTP